jgi:lipid-binding SYLF domain-containing protein
MLAQGAALVWLSMSLTLAATPPLPAQSLVRSSTSILRRSVCPPSAAIPTAIMQRARGVAVVHAARKDGEIHSGFLRYGVGIVSARMPGERWTPPAAFAFQAVLPVNLETDTVDFVLVALTPRGVDYLTQDTWTLPVVRGISPGPVGRITSEKVNADLLAYMQFGDYFAGVSINEWLVLGLKSGNAELYGKPYSSNEVLRGAGFFHDSPSVQSWRDTLAAYFRES